MATPTGTRANEARGYLARERRRIKQNQKDFDIAGLFAVPFDFGAMSAGQDSPNSLLLPADVKIAVQPSVAMVDFDIFIGNDFETYGGPGPYPAGGIVNLPQIFRKNQTIVMTSGDTAPAGTVTIYFRGPKSQVIQFGTVVFT